MVRGVGREREGGGRGEMRRRERREGGGERGRD